MGSDTLTSLPSLPIKRWSPKEYDALVRSGVLDDEERIELLHGVLVEMTPIGPAHTNLVARLNSLLAAAGEGKVLISPQSPLDCGDSLPQPDFAVLPLSEDRGDRLPRRALLVIEVADSSVERDRFKAKIYAGAAVPEYWLLNVVERTVEVHTEPVRRGTPRYRTIRILSVGDTLVTSALPKLKLPLATLFGRRH